MFRWTFSFCLIASLFLVSTPEPSVAQAPDRLDHFRVLPRFSTLHKTGGFAGLDQRFRVRGEYDFLRLFDEGTFSAKFDNSELWGTIDSDEPHIAIVEDVDQAFNLDELDGRLLPLGGPLDVYKFDGRTGDGSNVDLHAIRLGPWMYVRGRTTPPPGSADFFEYQLRMLARSQPWADLNEDDVVDAADYTILKDSGAVGYADWRSQFGQRTPEMDSLDAAMSAALASGSAVPEPSAMGLILLAISMIGVRRRK